MRLVAFARSLLSELTRLRRRRCDHVPSLFTTPLCCGLCGEPMIGDRRWA